MTKTVSSRSLVSHSNQFDLEIKSTDQFYIITKDGTRYLDFTSGWCVGNLGWNVKKIRQAVKQYTGPDYVAPAFSYQPWAELAELLCAVAPGKMQKCFRATGGSETVDIALQIAMLYTGRSQFISLEDSYHGNTIGSLSVGASSTAEKYPTLLPGCHRVAGEMNKKTLEKIETRLKKKEIAAVILEPVQVNRGVIIPESGFIKGLRRLCTKYGTLLIADEVACGFGRTGKLFACEHYELEPDILCLAKSMSCGYGPIGATLTSNKIYKKIGNKISIYSTYGWHPLAVSATIAAVEYMQKHQDDLIKNIAERSQQFRTALSQLPFKKGGKLSMIGLAIAVDLGDEKYAAQVRKKCIKKHLLVTTQGNKLVLFPPLTVSKNIVQKALDVLSEVI